jgi:hypothetical protein
MTPTKVEWYSKEEAGVRLGSPERPLSPRRILDLAKEGKIQSEKFKDPKTNQMTVRIHAGSVERYLDERAKNCDIRGDRIRQNPTESDTIRLMDLVRGLREGCAAHPARLFLTLSEAVDYSGLPAATLLEFLLSGRLPAIDVGRRRRGGRWRIRQVDLRKLSP